MLFSRPIIDQATATLAVDLSSWAYDPNAIVFRRARDRFGDIDLHIADIPSVGGRVLSLETNEACVIAFRGTALHAFRPMRSWIGAAQNLKTQISYLKMGGMFGVHSGYHEYAAKGLMIANRRAVHAWAAGKQVLFTGHSKGGAAAQIAALYWLARNVGSSCRVVTFGQPRSGTMRFATRFTLVTGDKAIRVTNRGDPAPGYFKSGRDYRGLRYAYQQTHWSFHFDGLPQAQLLYRHQTGTGFGWSKHGISNYAAAVRGSFPAHQPNQ